MQVLRTVVVHVNTILATTNLCTKLTSVGTHDSNISTVLTVYNISSVTVNQLSVCHITLHFIKEDGNISTSFIKS